MKGADEEHQGITAVAIDADKNSQSAVKWAVENLVHGNNPYCVFIHVQCKTTRHGLDSFFFFFLMSSLESHLFILLSSSFFYPICRGSLDGNIFVICINMGICRRTFGKFNQGRSRTKSARIAAALPSLSRILCS